jgi:thiamine-monophosphate kinase
VTIAEKALIAQFRRMAGSTKSSAIKTGIGDDCAVLQLSPPSSHCNDILVTTDFSLEGIHFQRNSHSPESIGHRCLARGLSDIAAMGGTPVAAFLSLALPPDLPNSWVRRFTQGLLTLARKYDVTLAGGDTAQSPTGILADIVVVGSAPGGKAVLRSGARPGDRIYVSGELGGAAAALAKIRKMRKPLIEYSLPDPRIKLGRILLEKGLASAMIDTSDGLSTDLAHICEESGVGAEIAAESIPRAMVGRPSRKVDLELALHGGEDYELLFTASAGKHIPSRIAGVPVTHIGQVIRGPEIFQTNRDGVRHPLKPQGWEHFRKVR